MLKAVGGTFARLIQLFYEIRQDLTYQMKMYILSRFVSTYMRS